MGVLLLVRHGQASFGSADYDRLSGQGREQARLLGAALAARGVRPELLVRGALRRHRETAEEAVRSAGWGSEVDVDEGWGEFDAAPGFTCGTGTSIDASTEALPRETHDDLVRRVETAIDRWASGEHDEEYRESFPAFRRRVDAALARTLARLGPRETAVVFTSGGPVSWAGASLSGGGVPVYTRLSKVVVNGSVTKVLDARRGPTLVSFNDHAHLETAGLVSYR